MDLHSAWARCSNVNHLRLCLLHILRDSRLFSETAAFAQEETKNDDTDDENNNTDDNTSDGTAINCTTFVFTLGDADFHRKIIVSGFVVVNIEKTPIAPMSFVFFLQGSTLSEISIRSFRNIRDARITREKSARMSHNTMLLHVDKKVCFIVSRQLFKSEGGLCADSDYERNNEQRVL